MNNNIKYSELGEERVFVSGTKNWRIDWAEINNVKFKVGTKHIHYRLYECIVLGKPYINFHQLPNNGGVFRLDHHCYVKVYNKDFGESDIPIGVFLSNN